MSYSSAVLADSPRAYYRLNDTAGPWADSSGNGLHMPTSGVMTFSQTGALVGDADKAVLLSGGAIDGGIGQYSATNVMTVAAGATVEAWIKTSTAGRYIGGAWGASSGLFMDMLGTSNRLRAYAVTAAGTVVVTSPTSSYADGTWHHIAAVYDGTALRLYVDGSQVASTASASTLNTSHANLDIGVRGSGGSRFAGTVDEFAFYNSALSAARIAAHYAAGTSAYSSEVLADNPLAYWRQADAASGATMADSSGNARNGSWASAASSASSLLIGDTNAASAHTGATNKYGLVPSASWMSPLTAVTLEAWFKTSSSGLQAIIGKTEAGGFGLSTAGSYRIFINDGALTFNVFDSSFQPMFTLTAGSGLANNAAHHVVGTWDGTTARLYVDGAQVGSTAASGTMAPVGTANLYVGIMGTNFPFNGTLDEAAVYDTALPAARVTAHYAAASAPVPTEVTADLTSSGTFTATAVRVARVDADLYAWSDLTASVYKEALLTASSADGWTGVFRWGEFGEEEPGTVVRTTGTFPTLTVSDGIGSYNTLYRLTHTGALDLAGATQLHVTWFLNGPDGVGNTTKLILDGTTYTSSAEATVDNYWTRTTFDIPAMASATTLAIEWENNADPIYRAHFINVERTPVAPAVLPPVPTVSPGDEVADTSITFSWAPDPASAPAASYEVRINLGDNEWVNVGTATQHTFTGLTPNTWYAVALRSKAADGTYSAESPNYSAQTLAAILNADLTGTGTFTATATLVEASPTWSQAVAATSPYGWWKFDETSGTTAADSSGNGHPGTYGSTGSLVYGVSSLIPSDTGTAINFTGVAPSMQVSGLSFSSVGSTYATTIKSSTDQTGEIFYSETRTNRLVIGASAVTADIAQAAAAPPYHTSVPLAYDPTALFDGVAHLVVWVVRTSSTELWVDGVMVASASHAVVNYPSLTQLRNKAYFGGPTGVFDDLVLWNTALSSAQIDNLWAGWRGVVPTSAPAVTAALTGTGAFTATTVTRPANDNWANAALVTIPTAGAKFTSTPVDNRLATTEAGEPNQAHSAYRSVWYKYTPSTSGTVTFDTVGSFNPVDPSNTYADTQIAVYTGSALNALTMTANNGDSGNAYGGKIFTSWLQFSATAGTTYWLQVGAYNNNDITYVVNVVGPASGAVAPAVSAPLTSTGAFTATATPVAVAVADNFDRADNASSLGATSTGAATWLPLAGTWGIASGRAYVAAGVSDTICHAQVQTGSADGVVSAVVTQVLAGDMTAGLSVRGVDASNVGYVFELQTVATLARLYKHVGGAYTQIAASAGNVVLASGDQLSVELSGNRIVARRNGVVLIDTTDATYTTQTRHGLYALAPSGGQGTAAFDDFSVGAAPTSVPAVSAPLASTGAFTATATLVEPIGHVFDSFNRADAPLTGSTADSGHVWLAGAYLDSPSAAIASNQASSSVANTVNVVETNGTDGEASVTFVSGEWPAVYVRESAAGRYRVEVGGGSWYLERDSSSTILASWSSALTAGDVIGLQAETVGGDTVLTVKKNGVALGTYTDSSASQRLGTRVGFGLGFAGTTIDDFEFVAAGYVETPAVNAPIVGMGMFTASVVRVATVAAPITGTGVFTATTVQAGALAATLASAGALTATVVVVAGATSAAAQLTGTGDLIAVVDIVIPAYLLILDNVVDQPPATIRAVMANLDPLAEVTFAIDGVPVATELADANGDILEITLPVDRQFGAGTHTLTGTTVVHFASATFTVLTDALALPTTPAPDVAPVQVAQPEFEVYRWVFQDLMPGGLGSWVMPINPSTMSNPHVRKTLAQASTTAVRGRFHLGEGATPIEWEFAGFAPDRAFQDQLIAYSELPYRFYIIDHRNRAWTVAITNLDIKPRNRVLDAQGQPQDWMADYTVKVALFSQTPTVLTSA